MCNKNNKEHLQIIKQKLMKSDYCSNFTETKKWRDYANNVIHRSIKANTSFWKYLLWNTIYKYKVWKYLMFMEEKLQNIYCIFCMPIGLYHNILLFFLLYNFFELWDVHMLKLVLWFLFISIKCIYLMLHLNNLMFYCSMLVWIEYVDAIAWSWF